MEWISVKDRLPEEYSTNLVWAPEYHDEPFVSIYKNKRFEDIEFRSDDEFRIIKEFVTHWMPLPKPPT